jgi:hypothetical protein
MKREELKQLIYKQFEELLAAYPYDVIDAAPNDIMTTLGLAPLEYKRLIDNLERWGEVLRVDHHSLGRKMIAVLNTEHALTSTGLHMCAQLQSDGTYIRGRHLNHSDKISCLAIPAIQWDLKPQYDTPQTPTVELKTKPAEATTGRYRGVAQVPGASSYKKPEREYKEVTMLFPDDTSQQAYLYDGKLYSKANEHGYRNFFCKNTKEDVLQYWKTYKRKLVTEDKVKRHNWTAVVSDDELHYLHVRSLKLYDKYGCYLGKIDRWTLADKIKNTNALRKMRKDSIRQEQEEIQARKEHWEFLSKSTKAAKAAEKRRIAQANRDYDKLSKAILH